MLIHLLREGQFEEYVLQAFVSFRTELTELIHGTAGNKPPLVNNTYSVTETFRNFKDVGRKKHCIPLVTVVAHKVLEKPRRSGIKAYHGLIKYEQRRIVEQGSDVYKRQPWEYHQNGH